MAGGSRSRKVSAAEGSTETPGKSKGQGRKLSKVPEAENPASPSTTTTTLEVKRQHDKVSKSRVSSCFSKSDPGSSRATKEAVPSTPVSSCFKSAGRGTGDLPPGFLSSSTQDVVPGENGKLKVCSKCGELGHSSFSCTKEREVQQPGAGDAAKAAAIKTRLTDEEREECRRLKKCYTCGESGHPYFKCPQEEKRLHAIQAEKESKQSTKLWREPSWMYKSASGQSQGPYTLSRLATKLHEGSFSSQCEVTHLHKKISMSLGKIMESADDGTLVTLLNGRAEPAIQKVEVNASKDTTLYAVQTKLHSEVVQITGRLIFNSAINEKLQEWLLLKKPLSRAVDAVESVVRPAESVGEPAFEPSSHQPTFDSSTQQDLEPTTSTEPAATVQEPPPPGCANTTEQSATPAFLHSNVRTPLEAVQQSLHSAVLGAAKRTILDAVVGQYLQDWITKKESEKKALQAIRDNVLVACQEVEISTFESEHADGPRTVQSPENEEAAVPKKESEDMEASTKKIRHTKHKSQASDSEPQKKVSRKRLVKVVDAEEVSQEASEADIKSPGEAGREQDSQLQVKKEESRTSAEEKPKKRSRRRKKDEDVEDHQPKKKRARKRLVNNEDDDDSDSEVRGKLIGKETLLPELPDEPLEDFRMEFAMDSFQEAEAGTQGEASTANTGQPDAKKNIDSEETADPPEEKPDAEKPDQEEKLKKLQPFTRRKQTRKLPVKAGSPVKSELKKEQDLSPRQKKAPKLAWPDAHDCSRCFIDGWQWRDWSRSMKRSGLVSNQAPELERENVLDHGNNSLQSARKNRAQRRNLAVAAELNVSHLKARKKRLKFQRSKIHSWGLVALERIEPEDFVIEYVGEVVRSKVADLREKLYERNGMDSSYLFRIDAENVVDATKHGGLARFINHSCDPNCYTKIIHVEGQKRIFIYSKKTIEIGEELTYDYKFPLEEQKIPCFCGAARCRRYMN